MTDWDPTLMGYQLDDDYYLERADKRAFDVHYAVYRENNRFRRDWEIPLLSVQGGAPCFWINRQTDGLRAGGVIVQPNALGPVFLCPPHDNLYELLTVLKAFMLRISDPQRPITAAGVLPAQKVYFHRLGFAEQATRRAMTRPTEAFGVPCPAGFESKHPTREDGTELALLQRVAFRGGIDEAAAGGTIEEHLADMHDYFNALEGKTELLSASTVLFHGDRLAGACLVSETDGWPYVESVAVHPDFRGNGLAASMLRRALTKLHGVSPILLLFVTLGNPAEKLYYDMGFLPGMPVSRMVLPHGRVNVGNNSFATIPS